MAKDIIEILSPYGADEPIQRMKIDALKYHLGNDFDFRPFGQSGGDRTACVLINNCLPQDLFTAIQTKARSAIIMLFLPDLIPEVISVLRNWVDVVDVILVGTPEMRNFFSTFTSRQVEVLIDPIDFLFKDSVEKPRTETTDRPLKVVWFGYPQSYAKSFTEYGKRLTQLHQSNEIEFNIVSQFESYGRTADHILHEYVTTSFPSLLEMFDVCVSSHAPLDFSLGTLWKSENKAVLAINRGLPTVASRTPAHERLFAKCGLEEFLFSSKDELVAVLRRLKSWPERHRFLTLSQKFVLENYSSRKMADDWLHLYQAARARKPMHQESKQRQESWRSSFWSVRIRST